MSDILVKQFLPDTLCASANASVHFALHCLESTPDGNLRASSSFVDPEGEAMLWHDFGPLAVRLVTHMLNDGFV